MRRQRPATDAEWARDTENRVRRLESGSTAVRVGQWVLSDQSGELVATSLDGRSVVLSQLKTTASDAADTGGVTGRTITRIVTVTLTGAVTGGTFTLTFDGATTDPIDFDASAAELREILGALPNYGASDFTVSGVDGGPWTVGIPGVSITGDNSGLTYIPLAEGDVVIS